jgi:hypothetical protein
MDSRSAPASARHRDGEEGSSSRLQRPVDQTHDPYPRCLALAHGFTRGRAHADGWRAQPEVGASGREATVTVRGEVDCASGRLLADELGELLDHGICRLTVDLAGMTFIDSTGLATAGADRFFVLT